MIPAVEAVRAESGGLPLVERLSGVVRAKNQVEIYPEISAVIEKVHAEDGEWVSKGDPLVSLRDREFRERLKQSEAALQIARAEAKQAEARMQEISKEQIRSRTLAEQSLISEAELESVESQALSAEADVQLARAKIDQALANVAETREILSQTVVRAPISATVGNRNAEVGMIVGTGTRLYTLGQLDSVEVEIVLTDRMLAYIESGQRAEIQSSSAGGVVSAPLSRISPFLHPVTHSTTGEIDLPNPDGSLKSGMFVAVDVFYGESEEATLVPLSALYENPLSGATGLYVARDTAGAITDDSSDREGAEALTAPVMFQFVPVEVVAKGRMSAGIRGVEPGSWVVTIGQDLFGGKEGEARVRPVDWQWVEHLQNLKREDLIEEIVSGRAPIQDTAS